MNVVIVSIPYEYESKEICEFDTDLKNFFLFAPNLSNENIISL